MSLASRTLRSATLRLGFVSALAGVLLHAPDAAAQTDEERAGARVAATKGAEAFSAQRYAEAVDLFTRAESLVHAPTHLLYIARAQEKLGKLVRAREAYLKIARERIEPNAPPAFRAAQAEAQKALTALEPRIPYLTIQVEGAGAESAGVTMDGAPIPPALVGLPYPVDPGEHKLQATANGMASDERAVSVQEGQRDTVLLKLQPSSAAAAPAPAPAIGEAMPVTTTAQADTSTASSGPNAMRIGGFVALGVGVVGLGAGTFFLLRANSKSSEADDLCTETGGGCSELVRDEVNALDDDADSARTLSTVGFIAGGVGVAAGVTLLILSGKSSSPKEQASRYLKPGVTPFIGYRAAGIQGRF
ncbi:MAG TPA: hypothetical protein VI072_24670 [Polyangiaceae bacterium]